MAKYINYWVGSDRVPSGFRPGSDHPLVKLSFSIVTSTSISAKHTLCTRATLMYVCSGRKAAIEDDHRPMLVVVVWNDMAVASA